MLYKKKRKEKESLSLALFSDDFGEFTQVFPRIFILLLQAFYGKDVAQWMTLNIIVYLGIIELGIHLQFILTWFFKANDEAYLFPMLKEQLVLKINYSIKILYYYSFNT